MTVFVEQRLKPNKLRHCFLSLLEHLQWQGDARDFDNALPQSDTLDATGFLNSMAVLGYVPKAVKADELTAEMLPALHILSSPSNRGSMPQDGKSLGENKQAARSEAWVPAFAGMTAEVLVELPKKHLHGQIFTFDTSKTTDISANKTTAASEKPWFYKLLYRFRSVFKQVLIASLFINLLALIMPLFMMGVYDKVIGSYSQDTLRYLLAGMVVAVTVEYMLRVLRTDSLSWFAARIDYIVSNAILEKLMALPANYTERASVAAQLSRLKAFESVREFFTSSLFLTFIEVPFIIILLATIAIIAGPLVLIPLVIAGLYGLLLLASRNRLKNLTTRMATANNKRQNIHIETLSKQETLRHAGGYDAWLERYGKTSAEASYAGFLYTQALTIIDTIAQAFVIIGGMAMIYFGIHRIWDGQMSVGALIAVLILTWRTLSPLQMLCTALPRLEQVKRNITQINQLMTLQNENVILTKVGTHTSKPSTSSVLPNSRENSGMDSLFQGNDGSEVTFHQVGLRYSKDADPVYAGLTFTAKAGEKVAIVGANSTGKSTTLKLISGLYHPQAGAIRINGTDIRQINPTKLRQNIAYVSQDPEFFDMRLAENMRLVNPSATDNDIHKALEAAGLDEWARCLEDGLKTPLDNLCHNIKPQLALARAYLQDSPILLIDELPYEFLNSKAGEAFKQYLKNTKNQTIFYVTYRQDYINLADKVIQLYNDERPQIKEKLKENNNV